METPEVPNAPQAPDALWASSLVADGGMADRIATGFLRYRLSRPQVLIGWPLIAVAVLAFGLTQDALVPSLIFLLVIFPSLTWVLYLQSRKSMRKFYAPGSTHSTSFAPTSMTITGPYGSSVVQYRLFKEIWIGSSVVVLRQRPTKIANLLPLELVPAEVVPLIRAGILAPQ